MPKDPLERLAAYGRLYQIEAASMTHLIHILGEIKDGRITNGRQMAKAQGIPNHKTHPATGALFSAWAFLEQADQDTRSFIH